jgi:hypothetical protein
MSASRRNNPVGVAVGVGIVGLLAAGAAWWYVSRSDEEADAVVSEGRLFPVKRSFDTKSAKALAAQAAAARGGKKVGASLSALRPGVTSAGPRYRPSGAEASAEAAPEESNDLTQPFEAEGAPL